MRCLRSVAPEDGTLLIAIKTGVVDQFGGLGAQIFAGRKLRTLPFNSVDELMRSLKDLALNQTRATASLRLSGRVATHKNINRVYHHASRGRQYGGIMSVEDEYFEDKGKEFRRVHAIVRERGGFARVIIRTLHFTCCSNRQKSVMLPAHYMGHAV